MPPAGDAAPSAPVRADALEIFRAGLAAADPDSAGRRGLAREGDEVLLLGAPLPEGVRRVRCVAFGKAACAMAGAAADVLPPALFPGPGVAVTSRGSARPVPRFQVLEAGHPLPDAGGLAGTRAVLAKVRGSREDDLVLVLISGGGSALLPAPAAGITLEDKVAVTRLLLQAGADIHELNTVRKHLSVLKGGGLARAASPALVRALILSDVIGDDLSVIASGPVSPDPSTFADARNVLRRRNVWERAPASVRARIERGARGEVKETPKPGDPVFDRVDCRIVGSNSVSLDAAMDKARAFGYLPQAFSEPLIGEARAAASRLLDWAVSTLDSTPAPVGRVGLLAGGETTVTVRGTGRGGRNQELALALALGAERLPAGWDWAFLSAGTDGIDGPTDAAGGLVDSGTAGRIARQGLDPRAALEANDSYPALEAAGDLLRIGPTGTNVADLIVLLARRAQPRR